MSKVLTPICLFGAALCLTLNLQAETIRLFTMTGQPVKNYEEKAISLQQGDTLVFSNGKRFGIERALGNGFASLVYETIDGKVLRIAATADYREMNADYLNGYRVLKSDGVPVVTVIESESFAAEYLLVEKIVFRFTLEDLINSNRRYSEQNKEQMFRQLMNFADQVGMYSTIGDFHPGQLVYDGNKWLLLDFSNDHVKPNSKRSQETVFDGFSEDQITKVDNFFGNKSFDALKNKTLQARIRGPRKMCNSLFVL